MAQYVKRIKVRNERLEFIFTEIKYSFELRFFITVLDENDNLFCFHMMKSDNLIWQILEIEKLPDWLQNLENELSIVIKKLK